MPIICSWLIWQRAEPSMVQLFRLKVLASNLVLSTWSLIHSRTFSAVQEWGLVCLYHCPAAEKDGVYQCVPTT